MKDPFYIEGLQFECQRCSRCCRHEPGYVYLSRNDLLGLSNHLKMSEEDFIRNYCRRAARAGGFSLSLIEKDNFDCIFWESGICIVYDARPFQCRSYPFWDNYLASKHAWKGLSESCPGVNQGRLHTFEMIEHWRYLRSLETYSLTAGT